MSDDDHFLRKAADAQAWAEKAQTPESRAAWLKLAQTWLSLVGRPTSSPGESNISRSGADTPERDELLARPFGDRGLP
jgi:hypothetical protein